MLIRTYLYAFFEILATSWILEHTKGQKPFQFTFQKLQFNPTSLSHVFLYTFLPVFQPARVPLKPTHNCIYS